MIRPLALWVAAAVLATSSCKKDGASATGTPIAAKSTDSLWKLAPPDLQVGFVMADGTGAALYDGAERLMAALEKFPAGTQWVKEVRGSIADGLPINPLDKKSLEAAGIDLSRGLAVFRSHGHEAFIVPVVDRKKFLAVMEGTSEEGVDQLFGGYVVCKDVLDRYACSSDKNILDTLGKGKSPVADWPKNLRGHIEVHASAMPSTPPIEFKSARASVRFERGAATMRFHVQGKPLGELASIRSKPGSLSTNVINKRPSGLMVLNAGSIWQNMKPMAIEQGGIMKLPGGGTLGDLVGALTGEVVGYGLSGVPAGAFKIGISNRGPFDKLLAQCGTLAASAPPGIVLAQKGSACQVTVQPAALGIEQGVEFTAHIATEDGALVVRVGEADAVSDAGTAPLGPFAREIVDGKPIYGAWGHGWYGEALMNATGFEELMAAEPAIAVVFWALPHLVEMGMWADVRDDGFHGALRVRTTWANPPALADAIDDKLAEFAVGKTGGLAGAGELAKSHPGSPFAADVKAGTAGMMAPVALFGVGAAVAIPAFMKYIKKSKTSEARHFVRKLSDGAREYAFDKDSLASMDPSASRSPFPADSVGPTPPAGSCCNDGEKCAPDASQWEHPTWSALRFSVDDPHYYSYQYVTEDEGQSFTVRAIGDLDCDGDFSVTEIRGRLDGDGVPVVDEVTQENELE